MVRSPAFYADLADQYSRTFDNTGNHRNVYPSNVNINLLIVIEAITDAKWFPFQLQLESNLKVDVRQQSFPIPRTWRGVADLQGPRTKNQELEWCSRMQGNFNSHIAEEALKQAKLVA